MTPYDFSRLQWFIMCNQLLNIIGSRVCAPSIDVCIFLGTYCTWSANLSLDLIFPYFWGASLGSTWSANFSLDLILPYFLGAPHIPLFLGFQAWGVAGLPTFHWNSYSPIFDVPHSRWQESFRHAPLRLCLFYSVSRLLWCKIPEPKCYIPQDGPWHLEFSFETLSSSLTEILLVKFQFVAIKFYVMVKGFGRVKCQNQRSLNIWAQSTG